MHKHIIYLVLLVLGLQTSVNAQTVTELHDLRDIGFAGGLKDYLGVPVDSLKCDLYYPTGAMSNQKFPVIISNHAGSFTGGSKIGQTPGADAMADEGFVVVAPDYRTGYPANPDSCADDTTGLNGATYRAAQDVNSCIRYLYANADKFNIDTNWIFLMGNSAGADLSLHEHFITDAVAKQKYPLIYLQEGGMQSTGNAYPFSYKIKGICAMWGGLPNWNLITPTSAVPMILFKGGLDPGLPEGVGYYKKCTNYTELVAGIGIYKIMTAIGAPCVYHYQPLGVHAAYDEEFCTKMTACYFKAIMEGRPYSGNYLYYQASCQ